MDDQKPECCQGCQDLNWWAMLVVAVLAVPSLGIVVSLLSGARGFFPGLSTGADQFDNLINAISHGFLRCDCFISTLIGSCGSDNASDQ